jgi:hypothetical protein
MTAEIIGTFAIIFAITFIVEASVEYIFGTIFDKVPKLVPYKWVLMYVSLLVGIGVSFFYKFDLLSLLATTLGISFSVTWVGILFSGLVIGRGSNFLHQFVSKFFPAKQPDA